jgi:hypothetical protein
MLSQLSLERLRAYSLRKFKSGLPFSNDRAVAALYDCLRLDNERGLQTIFQDWATEKGIKIEYTVPHTPEKNGFAERSGRMLLDVARTIRIRDGLPTSLWPEPV